MQTVHFEADGRFRVEDVKPGTYAITLRLAGKLGERLAHDSHEITVPPMPDDGTDPGPLDLGTISYKLGG